MNASEKQIKYALYLLDQAGYSTRYMDSRFKGLGATMRERSGRVSDWLADMPMHEISKLIDRLKMKAQKPNESTESHN